MGDVRYESNWIFISSKVLFTNRIAIVSRLLQLQLYIIMSYPLAPWTWLLFLRFANVGPKEVSKIQIGII